jgi:hypothetical protein
MPHHGRGSAESLREALLPSIEEDQWRGERRRPPAEAFSNAVTGPIFFA